MIIHLKKSALFTTDPDIRFAREYNLPIGTLREIYRWHKVNEFDVDQIREFHTLKTGRIMSNKSIRRWIWRAEIYSLTLPVLEKGAQVVTSSFFKDHEWRVIKEITKNLRPSVHGQTKTLI